ncbi:MAG: hypothetical protein EBS53_11605 [Bacteroidetes bacterium]|nr:hypothetical protein [Bacteroidota bacterium]
MGSKMKIYRDENGRCVNIGEWNNLEGKNPMPDNLTESDEEVIIGWDGGLYVHDDPRANKS